MFPSCSEQMWEWRTKKRPNRRKEDMREYIVQQP
jgi:hypothetical protein